MIIKEKKKKKKKLVMQKTTKLSEEMPKFLVLILNVINLE